MPDMPPVPPVNGNGGQGGQSGQGGEGGALPPAGPTAPPSVTAPPSTADQDTISPVGGIIVGTVRSPTQDVADLTSRQTATTTAQSIRAIQVAAAAQTTTPASIKSQAVSQKQILGATQNLTVVSERAIADTIRALQKTQSRCNHNFNRATRRCEYCTKHRDSHIYDVGNKSLLNQ